MSSQDVSITAYISFIFLGAVSCVWINFFIVTYKYLIRLALDKSQIFTLNYNPNLNRRKISE